jgi:hypothetical protein
MRKFRADRRPTVMALLLAFLVALAGYGASGHPDASPAAVKNFDGLSMEPD